jgi:hypothetical protein
MRVIAETVSSAEYCFKSVSFGQNNALCVQQTKKVFFQQLTFDQVSS